MLCCLGFVAGPHRQHVVRGPDLDQHGQATPEPGPLEIVNAQTLDQVTDLLGRVVPAHALGAGELARGPSGLQTVGYIERKSQYSTRTTWRRMRTSERPP